MPRRRAIASRLVPVLVVIIFALAAPAIISNIRAHLEGCPAHCNCTNGGTELTCDGHCPAEISARVTALRCLHMRWKTITADKLRPYTHVESLDLSMGTISMMAGDAFAAMARLRALNLSHNDLRLVPRDAFSACERLEQLDLSGNALALPAAAGPVLASSSLAALDLSRCGLARLPEKAFAMLPRLAELRLRGNRALRRLPRCLLNDSAQLSFVDADPALEELIRSSNLRDCREPPPELGDQPTTTGEREAVPGATEGPRDTASESHTLSITMYSVVSALFGCISFMIVMALYKCICRRRGIEIPPPRLLHPGSVQTFDE